MALFLSLTAFLQFQLADLTPPKGTQRICFVDHHNVDTLPIKDLSPGNDDSAVSAAKLHFRGDTRSSKDAHVIRGFLRFTMNTPPPSSFGTPDTTPFL